ncbi:MAG: ABC transporter ATP-binding protein [Anaerotruncus massiliensis (ex Togo et al. 2019)]
MLNISNLKVNYGGIEAVKGISFTVPEKSIVTLIGANGAGKSTTLRAIAGLVPIKGGTIEFLGKQISGLPSEKIVGTGIPSPRAGGSFDLTVLKHQDAPTCARMTWRHQLGHDLFPRLKERSWQLAGTLSGGEQQMLAVGRALMSRPKLIMMDEPSLGLAPLIVQGIFDIIKEINRQGVTILLIEQNANLALRAADYGYVLETGNITLDGTGAELLENEDVKAAYLGKKKK